MVKFYKIFFLIYVFIYTNILIYINSNLFKKFKWIRIVIKKIKTYPLKNLNYLKNKIIYNKYDLWNKKVFLIYN